ncbi:GntR family transcriptional regulator [Brevibacillus sp. B_LB10_24]|uniref:GntR family transcriptional regulator n=1 Tax=Brevibacillus sp. B_LB10_24 TaxID=3380645 RepID=UPI0038B9B386
MIDKSNLTDRVYLLIRDKILNKELKPGERINYDLLCEELGISKTPLRDAINRLQQDGLIEVKPRSGTFVYQPHAKNITDIYDVRKALECLSLSLGLERIPEEIVSQLLEDANQATLYLQQNNYKGYFSIDRNIHSTIIRYSNNDYVIKIMESLEYQLQWFSVLTTKNFDRPYHSNEQHKEILKAIQRKDREKAIDLLAAHIEEAKIMMLEDYGA